MRLRKRRFRIFKGKPSLTKGISAIIAILGIWLLAMAIPVWVWLTLLGSALLWVAIEAWNWKGRL